MIGHRNEREKWTKGSRHLVGVCQLGWVNAPVSLEVQAFENALQIVEVYTLLEP